MIKQCCFYVEMMLSQCIFPKMAQPQVVGSTFVQFGLVILDETENTRILIHHHVLFISTDFISYHVKRTNTSCKLQVPFNLFPIVHHKNSKQTYKQINKQTKQKKTKQKQNKTKQNKQKTKQKQKAKNKKQKTKNKNKKQNKTNKNNSNNTYWC